MKIRFVKTLVWQSLFHFIGLIAIIQNCNASDVYGDRVAAGQKIFLKFPNEGADFYGTEGKLLTIDDFEAMQVAASDSSPLRNDQNDPSEKLPFDLNIKFSDGSSLPMNRVDFYNAMWAFLNHVNYGLHGSPEAYKRILLKLRDLGLEKLVTDGTAFDKTSQVCDLVNHALELRCEGGEFELEKCSIVGVKEIDRLTANLNVLADFFGQDLSLLTCNGKSLAKSVEKNFENIESRLSDSSGKLISQSNDLDKLKKDAKSRFELVQKRFPSKPATASDSKAFVDPSILVSNFRIEKLNLTIALNRYCQAIEVGEALVHVQRSLQSNQGSDAHFLYDSGKCFLKIKTDSQSGRLTKPQIDFLAQLGRFNPNPNEGSLKLSVPKCKSDKAEISEDAICFVDAKWTTDLIFFSSVGWQNNDLEQKNRK